jgi:hypothetical protein
MLSVLREPESLVVLKTSDGFSGVSGLSGTVNAAARVRAARGS